MNQCCVPELSSELVQQGSTLTTLHSCSLTHTLNNSSHFMSERANSFSKSGFICHMESASHLICLVSFLGFSKILWLIPCFHKGAMWRWKWPGLHLLSSIRLQFSNSLLRAQAAPWAAPTFASTFQSLGADREGTSGAAGRHKSVPLHPNEHYFTLVRENASVNSVGFQQQYGNFSTQIFQGNFGLFNFHAKL